LSDKKILLDKGGFFLPLWQVKSYDSRIFGTIFAITAHPFSAILAKAIQPREKPSVKC
jgi:hypothetical protein